MRKLRLPLLVVVLFVLVIWCILSPVARGDSNTPPPECWAAMPQFIYMPRVQADGDPNTACYIYYRSQMTSLSDEIALEIALHCQSKVISESPYITVYNCACVDGYMAEFQSRADTLFQTYLLCLVEP